MLDKQNIFLFLVFFFLFSCIDSEDAVNEKLYQIDESEQLPEQLIAVDTVSGMSAQYIYPTSRYDHGILGDKIEAGGLIVEFDKKQSVLELDSSFVFEDLQPRLVDMDNDGIPEIITILTKIGSGASVSIYKLKEGIISKFASGEFIGIAYRWLNIAAINDLDNDGKIEIAYVTTPHIGGDLHIARVVGNELKVICSLPGLSNHKIRSRNLCLSEVSVSDGEKTLYLPNDNFDSILGFQLINEQLIPVDSIAIVVNPYVSLSDQYQFKGSVQDESCINAE